MGSKKTDSPPGRFAPKSSPEIKEKIIEYLQLGLQLVEVLKIVGITLPTLTTWRKADEGFDSRARDAENQVKAGFLKKIDDIIADKETDARTRLNALTWRLEKRFPLEFGSRATLNLVETMTGEADLSTDELVAAATMALDELDADKAAPGDDTSRKP